MLLRRMTIAIGTLTLALGMSLGTTSGARASSVPAPTPSPSAAHPGTFSPAVSPAPDAVPAIANFAIQNYANIQRVHNNGHDQPVTMGGGSNFVPQNAELWNGVDIWQWQSGGLCLTETPTRQVRMESCANTSSTYWYTHATGGGNGAIWFISVYYTDTHNGAYGYMTTVNNYVGSQVTTYGPGYGNAAVWQTPQV
jgi:hypothetical protein